MFFSNRRALLVSTWLCGSRHLAIDELKAKSELSTAAYSRSEARAVRGIISKTSHYIPSSSSKSQSVGSTGSAFMTVLMYSLTLSLMVFLDTVLGSIRSCSIHIM